MKLALSEAEKGWGLTAPNPPVGAIIVHNERVVSKGWHAFAGAPHAEIVALEEARKSGQSVEGATLYVTLEPCSTEGRTGACTEAILSSGIARVVWGSTDPHPGHQGNACSILESEGLTTTAGVAEKECDRILRGFRSRVQRGRPWVVGKIAQSLDGRIVRPGDEGQWLTGESARFQVQMLRAKADAIVTSGTTIRQDDPSLTLRIPHPYGHKNQPWRIVLSRSGEVPETSRVFNDDWAELTKLFHVEHPAEVFQELGRMDCNQVLVEAGGQLLGRLLRDELIDELIVFSAPLLCGVGLSSGFSGLGSLPGSIVLDEVKVQAFDQDACVQGLVRYPEP